MKPTDKEVAEAMQWLRQSADEGKEFVVEQAPLYVQELIAYSVITHGGGILIGIVLAAILAWVCLKCFGPWLEKASIDAEPAILIGGTISGILSVIFLMLVVFGFAPNLAKAVFAPRVLVVEKLMGNSD